MDYFTPDSRYAGYNKVLQKDLSNIYESLEVHVERPLPPPKESIVHIATEGETLDMLAWRYYGNEKLWWKIMDANRLVKDDGQGFQYFDSNTMFYQYFPLYFLRPGQILKIPPLYEATLVSRKRDF